MFSALVSFKNVVSKFVHNGSSVFGCFLDASKAFDRVNHDILFSKLMERGIPPILNHLLQSYFLSLSWFCSLEALISSHSLNQGFF